MISPALQELRSYFGRDFLLGVFFPVLIYLGVNLALYFEVFKEGLGVALADWEKLLLQTQILSILTVLIIITVLSYLIYNFQYSITRLFEGYWPHIGIFRWLRNKRTGLYQRRWDYLKAQIGPDSKLTAAEMDEIAQEQHTFYPPKAHLHRLMPTRLGNILRASEIYALDRYGIDSVIIWTRLNPLLTDKATISLQDSKIAMDFMLLMSVLATTITLIWCPLLAIFTNHLGLFLLCALGWPFAWICYQNAVQRSFDYGEELKAIFDLYRHELLKALNRPIPADIDAERKEWQALSFFFYYNYLETSEPPIWKRAVSSLVGLFRRK